MLIKCLEPIFNLSAVFNVFPTVSHASSLHFLWTLCFLSHRVPLGFFIRVVRPKDSSQLPFARVLTPYYSSVAWLIDWHFPVATTNKVPGPRLRHRLHIQRYGRLVYTILGPLTVYHMHMLNLDCANSQLSSLIALGLPWVGLGRWLGAGDVGPMRAGCQARKLPACLPESRLGLSSK